MTDSIHQKFDKQLAPYANGISLKILPSFSFIGHFAILKSNNHGAIDGKLPLQMLR
jgi:hypothetical protein